MDISLLKQICSDPHQFTPFVMMNKYINWKNQKIKKENSLKLFIFDLDPHHHKLDIALSAANLHSIFFTFSEKSAVQGL